MGSSLVVSADARSLCGVSMTKQPAHLLKVSLDIGVGISAQRSRSPAKSMDFDTARPQPMAQARPHKHNLRLVDPGRHRIHEIVCPRFASADPLLGIG